MLAFAALLLVSAFDQAFAPNVIDNGLIHITTGTGSQLPPYGPQGDYTIFGIAPTNHTWKDIVFFGEYEYLSKGPRPNDALWPDLVSLWNAPRTFLGWSFNSYKFKIGPVMVGTAQVFVNKTVTVPTTPGAWGWARIEYSVSTNETIGPLWLYYSIDYCDGPVTGNTGDRIFNWNGPLGPISSSGQNQVPSNNGGLQVNTVGSGIGVLISSPRGGGSNFMTYRYAGLWNDAILGNWVNGRNIAYPADSTGALAINLISVEPGHETYCDQIVIGYIPADPPDPLEEEPPVPDGLLVATFDITPPLTVWKEKKEPHKVEAYSGKTVGKNLTFDASSSFKQNGTIVSYFWDFGDGTNATEVTVDHSYRKNGVYTVKLTVTDNASNTDDAEATFKVSGGVGGVQVPLNKFALAAPYMGIASTILVGTVATAAYIKRVKQRKTKNKD
jgi:hypothetical protein